MLLKLDCFVLPDESVILGAPLLDLPVDVMPAPLKFTGLTVVR